MKKTVMILLVGIAINVAIAQQHIPTLDDYKRFLTSKTMVVWDEVQLSQFNWKIKEVMDRAWTLTPVEYITFKEFEKLKNDPDLSFIINNVASFDSDKIKARFDFLSLLMGQPDQKLRNLPDLCSLPLSYAQVDDDTYSYKLEAFILFMQAYVNEVLADPTLIGDLGFKKYSKKKGGNLSDKTLYLLKNEVAKDINDEKKIKAVYPYAVKFVTPEEIEAAIARRDNNVVFMHKVGPTRTTAKTRVYKIIVGAGDSKLYFHTHQMMKSAADNAIQAKDLKKMSK
ncbi:MAG: hypothetical protein FWH18_08355 [Marinilabiliaceae bacterium]|nr:hypothetical protein [Marinilabiliaceae bacterium]